MAIGLKYSRSSADEKVDDTYSFVQEFIRKFNDKHGSINCYELTECDFSSEEGHEKFDKENKIMGCRKFVKDSEEIACELIIKSSE